MLRLVFNPTAGKGRARKALAVVTAFLDARSVAYTLHYTERPGHATELAAAAAPGSTVVALGGDGTIHEVVRGLLQGGTLTDLTCGRVLAVVPLGSGDDFAFSLGIERDDLSGALERLVSGEKRQVDLGFVNGEPFINALGTGFDAEVAQRVRTSPRLLTGLVGYLYSVVATLAVLDCPSAQVRLDGRLVHDGPALLIGAQNGPRTGGNFLFAPEAVNDDGLLDVVIASRLTRLGTMRLLPLVMRGKHVGHAAAKLHRCRSLRIDWASPRPGHADGEALALAASYEVELMAAALPVVA